MQIDKANIYDGFMMALLYNGYYHLWMCLFI